TNVNNWRKSDRSCSFAASGSGSGAGIGRCAGVCCSSESAASKDGVKSLFFTGLPLPPCAAECVLWQSLRVEFEHDGHRRSRIILSVAALKFAHEKKSSIRPGDALIAHASTFIEKNRLF